MRVFRVLSHKLPVDGALTTGKKGFCLSEADKGVFSGFKTGFQSSDQLPIFHTSICGSSREQ